MKSVDLGSQPYRTNTHTTGSKLRCQTPTNHTTKHLWITTSNFSQAQLCTPWWLLQPHYSSPRHYSSTKASHLYLHSQITPVHALTVPQRPATCTYIVKSLQSTPLQFHKGPPLVPTQPNYSNPRHYCSTKARHLHLHNQITPVHAIKVPQKQATCTYTIKLLQSTPLLFHKGPPLVPTQPNYSSPRPPIAFSTIQFNILSSRSCKSLFYQVSPPKPYVRFSSPNARHMSSQSRRPLSFVHQTTNYVSNLYVIFPSVLLLPSSRAQISSYLLLSNARDKEHASIQQQENLYFYVF